MGNDAIDRFFEKLARDPSLQAGLRSHVEGAVTAAVAQWATGRGFVFTAEELKRCIEDQSAELSEEQLGAVAGGVGGQPLITPSIMSCVTAGRPGDTPL